MSYSGVKHECFLPQLWALWLTRDGCEKLTLRPKCQALHEGAEGLCIPMPACGCVVLGHWVGSLSVRVGGC